MVGKGFARILPVISVSFLTEHGIPHKSIAVRWYSSQSHVDSYENKRPYGRLLPSYVSTWQLGQAPLTPYFDLSQLCICLSSSRSPRLCTSTPPATTNGNASWATSYKPQIGELERSHKATKSKTS
jgi:hypothetical protein